MRAVKLLFIYPYEVLLSYDIILWSYPCNSYLLLSYKSNMDCCYMIILPCRKYWDIIFLVVLVIYDFGDHVRIVIVLEFSFGFL